jgi:hypothetical protein
VTLTAESRLLANMGSSSDPPGQYFVAWCGCAAYIAIVVIDVIENIEPGNRGYDSRHDEPFG